ncbi:hypothetical protein B296_00039530, partial [Ensete ventricosum]
KKDLNITDLEAYIMALEEAINDKFEAFESCIEVRTLGLSGYHLPYWTNRPGFPPVGSAIEPT